MVKSELIEHGRRIRHYSDGGFRILQNETGIVYDDAVDALPCRYTYSETGELIEQTVEHTDGLSLIESVEEE